MHVGVGAVRGDHLHLVVVELPVGVGEVCAVTRVRPVRVDDVEGTGNRILDAWEDGALRGRRSNIDSRSA
eukprot:10169194-Heterocapsa_arctica.AAC.1